MNQKEAPPAARVAAAQALLDRGYGKAAQTIEAKIENVHHVARLPMPVETVEDWQSQAQKLIQ
jgi:hypothetical protein